MIELSKRVVDIAKTLNVQKPIRETLSRFLENCVEVDDPLGNKMSSGYILNVVNDVAVDICIKREDFSKVVKCNSCNDTKTIVVFEVCGVCCGTGYSYLPEPPPRGQIGRIGDMATTCTLCDSTGEFKTLIPCQDCKTEK